jgi:hypothetical protein
MRDASDLLAPKRTAALVVRGRLDRVERFLAELGPLAAREDILIVFTKTSPGRLTVVEEEARL